MKSAQEQTRQVLERVRHGIREADFPTLHMWVRELRTAAGRGDWHRALFFAQECPPVAERLRNAEGLGDDERNGLREAADNLRLVQAHIRNARLNTETAGLAASHAVSVGTPAGNWTVTGVRAQQVEADHTGDFIPVNATITVAP